MQSEYLSRVKKLVINKISISIGNSNLIEDAMSYSALAESKMVRAGLVFASSETNNNLHKDSVTTLAAAVELSDGITAELTIKTSFSDAYFIASFTQFGCEEYFFPKLKLIILAPLSTAYLMDKATSLSYSSPSGTHLIGMITM